VAAILVLGWLAYGFSLHLPFFWDDLLHFRWLEGSSLPQVWRAPQVFSHYRPLPFTIWKLLRSLQGRYDAPVQHALPVGLHILNAVLVLALVTRQQRAAGLLTGLGAATLFLLYPFSYQAVPWVGALTHPLVTALILGSLLLYLGSLDSGWKPRGQRAARATSLGLALIAPFAHQTGVLIAPLLLLLLLTDGQPRSPKDTLRQTWPYWACAALGVALWLAMPKEPMPPELLNLEGRWQTAVYFLQGLAYPVAPLATLLMSRARALSDLWAIVVVCLPVVIGWALLFWKAGRGRLVALALGWFVVAAAPAWAMIKFSNVVDGPRLLYEASAGAALLWALPLSLRPSQRRLAAGALVIAVVAAIAVGSYRFLQSRVPLYRQMRLATDQLAQACAARADSPLVCINYPSWFAPKTSTFAVGHEGVVLVPNYTSVSDILWLATSRDQPVTSLVLPDLLQPYRYNYACIGTSETAESIQPELRRGQVVVAGYEGDSVTVRDAGGLEAEGTAPAEGYIADFAEYIGLTQASGEEQGPALRVTLHWQCWKELGLDTTVFLHLYDGSGRLVAQADGYPLLGSARFTSWKQGDVWRDVRYLALPDRLAPGAYTVEVGLYPAGGGPRLVATDPTGRRLQDDAVPVATVAIR